MKPRPQGSLIRPPNPKAIAEAADADGRLSQLQDAVQADPRSAKLRAALAAALLQAKQSTDDDAPVSVNAADRVAAWGLRPLP